MKIKTAEFVTSIGNIAKYKSFDLPEITFVGRSNVGKSSLINALTNRKKLAKTSSLAGRTRLVNMFLINQKFMLVDLPGYGYAKASKEAQNEWQSLIGGYLQKSTKLKMVFVLVDLRIEPTDLDKQMLNFLYYYNIPFKVVGTKADKLTKSQVKNNMKKIALDLGLGTEDILYTSSETKSGVDDLLNYIAELVDYDNLKENKELIPNLIEERKQAKILSNEIKKLTNMQSNETKKVDTQKKGNTQKKQQPTKKVEQKNKKMNNNKVQSNKKQQKEDKPKVKHTPRYALKKKKGKK